MSDWSFHVYNQLTRNDHPQYQPVAANPTTLVTSLTTDSSLTLTGGDGAGHGALSLSVPQPAWTPVSSFLGAWVNFGGGTFAAAYRLVNDEVELRGTIKSGSIGTAAFTLPLGLRPQALFICGTSGSGAFGELRVNTSGGVVPNVGTTTYFCLDNVFFSVL